MNIAKKINLNLILIILLILCIVNVIFNNNEGYSNINIDKINFDFNNPRINKLLNYIATNYFNNKIMINELNNPNSINIDNLKNLNENKIVSEIQKIKDNLVNLSFSDIKYLLAYANIYRSVFNYFYISNNDNYNKKKLKMYLNIIDVGINELNKELMAKQNIVDNNMQSFTNYNIQQTFRTLACPIGETYLNNYFTNKSTDAKCCPPDHEYLDNKCCPTDKINLSEKKCCSDNQEVAINENLPMSLQQRCCPLNSRNIQGNCCPDSQSIGFDTCCPDNTNVTLPYDGGDGPAICCPPGKYNINGTCCDNINKINHKFQCYYPLVNGNS